MAKKSLSEILSGTDLTGLLTDIKPVSSLGSSDEARMRQVFDEVNSFVDKHGHVPGEGGKPSPSERMLSLALKGIRQNSAAIRALAQIDRHHLLAGAETQGKSPSSLDEIISTNSSLLSSDADEIFDIRNPSSQSKAKPDCVAERRSCPDLASFKPLFDQ